MNRALALARRHPWLTVLVFVVPVVALAIAMAQEHWYPTGDLGQAELHVRGFLRHPPLVGAAGRIGTINQQGSHPGPSFWVALYPTYLLLGKTAYGLMIAMIVLQVASIVAAVIVARRLGGLLLVGLVVAVVAALLRSSGAAFMVEPWNPWAAVLPFLVFLLLVAGMLGGDAVLAPWAILVGSHCIQSHIGYVVLVSGSLAVAAVVLVVRWRRGEIPGRRLAAVTAWCAGLLVLAWLPPVIDQLRRDPGNLRILWHHFTNPTDPPIGLVTAAKAFAGEFNLAGGLFVGQRRLATDTPVWWGFVAMVAIVAAGAWLAWRRRDRVALQLFAATGLASVLGVVAMSRIFGEFYGYVVRWLWCIVGLAVVAVGYTVGRELQRRAVDRTWSRVAAGATVVVAAVTVGVLTATTVGYATEDLPSRRDSRLVGGVVSQVEEELPTDGRYLVRWHDPASLGGVGYGVLLELERQGYTVGVDPWGSAAALPHRVMPESTATEVLWVVTGDNPIADFRARGDATELGYYDQRTPEERAESDRLRAELEQRLREIGHPELIEKLDTQYGLAPLVIGDAPVPQDVKDLAGAYNLLRLPIAVFAVPPGAPLYP